MTQKKFIKLSDIKEKLKNSPDLINELQMFEKIYVVTRGGLAVAGLLSQYLETRFYETICLQSYSDNKEKEEITTIKLTPTNEEILLIEDIVDSGSTLKFLEQFFPNAKSFALHVKPDVTKKMPDYYLWETNDWIVYPWEIE